MLEELIEKIISSSGLQKEEVLERIEAKKAEMANLISDEGAAYMIAKDMGFSKDQERLKIENILPGMQNAEIIGKITGMSQPKEFSTEHGKGRVQNLFIADETGSIRISLWNDELDKIGGLVKGDVIRVRGYVKESLNAPELRLGKKGYIQKENVEIDVPERKAERISLVEASPGRYCSVRAALIQVFESNPFYEVCSQCESRLKDGKCNEHGETEPKHLMVISGIIDDGTENIRAVFFRENAEKLLGMTTEQAKRLFMTKGTSGIAKSAPAGEEFIFEGVIKRNALFDRTEIMVNSIKKVNLKEEIESYLR